MDLSILKAKRILLAIMVVIFATSVLVFWTVHARAVASQEPADPQEQKEIEEIIKAYFENRYRSFHELKLQDFGELFDKSSSENSFLRSESDKLEVEIHHAQLYHLGYSQYKYYLDYKKISINPSTQIATVSVTEGHDVIFQISEEISGENPIVSVMRNLQHTIALQKRIDGWKIVSDTYEDFLWRLITSTKKPKVELLQEIPPSSNELPGLIDVSQATPTVDVDQIVSSLCPSLPVDESTHPYNRDGAIAYAHLWATATPPYNDPPYHDFTSEGGDCTNFVSQAIHEGGGSKMVFGGTHGMGTNGWYYYTTTDRAAAWLDVERLHSFITNGYEINLWEAGPEGCDVEQYQAYEGDLIQYNWKVNSQGTPDPNDALWDHGVIIVRSLDLGLYNRYHYVAAHSVDVYDYPFTSYSYTYPDMIYRFIHIDRIDGYSELFLPLVTKDGNSGASQVPNPSHSPYPAPIDSSTPSLPPYPAP